MSVSRKEFLTRGLAAFGQNLLAAARGEEPSQDKEQGPVACGPLLVDNRGCLSSRGGCFSCLDGCPREALAMVAGVGLVVDQDRCDGCGECIHICPIEPKPITLISFDAVK